MPQAHLVTPASLALPVCPVLLESQDLKEALVVLELKAFRVTLEYRVQLVNREASVYKERLGRLENLVLLGSLVLLENLDRLEVLALLVYKVCLVYPVTVDDKAVLVRNAGFISVGCVERNGRISTAFSNNNES